MARATEAGVIVDHAPPVAITRSGGGATANSGVASARRPRAARRDARRNAIPSPVASDHGAMRSSRIRSRSRCRSVVVVVQPSTRSTAASSGSAGTSRASGTIATSVEGGSPGPPRRRSGAKAAVEADLDDLDPAVEQLGEARGRGPDRASGVVGRRGELGEQVAQRRPGGALAGGGCEQGLPVASGGVAECRDAVRHGAGQDHEAVRLSRGDRGHERRQLGDRATLVGAGRVAGTGQHPVDRGIEEQRGHRQRVGRRGARGDDPPAAPGRGGRQGRQGALRRGDDAEGARCRGTHAHHRDRVDVGRIDAEPGRQRRGRGGEPLDDQRGGRVVGDGGGKGDRAEQAPGVADPTDERGTAGRAPAVGCQERPWIGGHRPIVPAEPVAGLAVRRPR